MTALQQIKNSRGAVGLFPSICQIRLVVWADYSCIGGDDQATFRIESLGQLVEWNVSRPFVVVGLAGNGNFTVAFFANGNPRGHYVTDISSDIGVHGILRRAPGLFDGFAKLVTIFCGAQPA